MDKYPSSDNLHVELVVSTYDAFESTLRHNCYAENLNDAKQN